MTNLHYGRFCPYDLEKFCQERNDCGGCAVWLNSMAKNEEELNDVIESKEMQ